MPFLSLSYIDPFCIVTNEKKRTFSEENLKRTYGEEREVTHSGYSIIVDEQKSCFDKKTRSWTNVKNIQAISPGSLLLVFHNKVISPIWNFLQLFIE